MPKNKDVFADIAAQEIGRKEELEEIWPREKPDRFFQETEKPCNPPAAKVYEDELEDFNKGIAKLREKYRKFTEVRYSFAENARKRVPVGEFVFGFEGGEKQNVKIPHYTGPAGRWKATYETEVELEKTGSGERVYLVCKGIDYRAQISLNGKHAGSHEGFFASFEIDVTDLVEECNKLSIEVENDIPTIGNGDMQVNGDKLYAATGIGWDSPEDGWHHCPAGGGIFDKVYFETRSSTYVKDIFIRPDIDNSKAEATVEVFCHETENREIAISLGVFPFNFDGETVSKSKKTVKAGYGSNFYKFDMDMGDFKLWEPDAPHMYICRCKTGKDVLERTFGMRKFQMSLESEPKGDLYLNNKPVLLRGANEMGHLQLCVIRNDYDRLIDDILIAKYCNMNFYRLTQRPVQEEIYHYCDMLGMMTQTDLPLFGFMRKNQFYEGVRQAGEMERHIRNHPSAIMSTYINEPFDPEKYGLSHRHLSRRELELFFDACDASVLFENPDRVIKRVEGDYDPPTEKGLSDFHCYNMWYTNHAIPLGKLYAGYLPAIKKGWKTGCGEYGTEGLDNYDVMQKYYPREWLPENDADTWIPDRIIKSQTNTMHGDWYGEQYNIRDWIKASQEHQAFATRLMTLALRRRADMVVSFAIHLLIDAWPSGWMKTLLDVDRTPKKAYFAFKESLEPLKANIRCDRWSAYSGEVMEAEAWVLNDLPEKQENLTVRASLENNNKIIESHVMECPAIGPCSSEISGMLKFKLPEVLVKTELILNLCLEREGETISSDTLRIAAYPLPVSETPVFCAGSKAARAASEARGVTSAPLDRAEAVLVSSIGAYEKTKNDIPAGTRIVFLAPEDGDSYEIGGREFKFEYIFDPGETGENCDVKGISFAATTGRLKDRYGEFSMAYWYNGDEGYIDHVSKLWVDGIEPLVFGYEKPSFGKTTSGSKKKLPVAGWIGENRFLAAETEGRTGLNPALDGLMTDLLTEETL